MFPHFMFWVQVASLAEICVCCVTMTCSCPTFVIQWSVDGKTIYGDHRTRRAGDALVSVRSAVTFAP